MKNLLKSLASFQQEVPVIHKATQGYGYSYADLPKIFEVINPLLKNTDLDSLRHYTQRRCQLHCYNGIPRRDWRTHRKLNSYSLRSVERYERLSVLRFRCDVLPSLCISVLHFRLVTDKDTDASGEQEKKEKKLPPIDQKRFAAAVQAIAKGEYTREKLEASFSLTEGQIDILNAL
jgi:hypothetical protein